ncbi:hypothetical protein MVEN_01964300 [Mycena venus]|uniref:Uncharacterized protein n=1 Tax=Mycena venus TaxID=2733690 RepID=A0A8H6XH83_9AGAR|nr:hypothetical protein MVEN_01964300 [Mycena venus]
MSKLGKFNQRDVNRAIPPLFLCFLPSTLVVEAVPRSELRDVYDDDDDNDAHIYPDDDAGDELQYPRETWLYRYKFSFNFDFIFIGRYLYVDGHDKINHSGDVSRSKRPRMVTKSYSLPLWKKSATSKEKEKVEDDEGHVVLKVALPSFKSRKSSSSSRSLSRSPPPIPPTLTSCLRSPSIASALPGSISSTSSNTNNPSSPSDVDAPLPRTVLQLPRHRLRIWVQHERRLLHIRSYQRHLSLNVPITRHPVLTISDANAARAAPRDLYNPHRHHRDRVCAAVYGPAERCGAREDGAAEAVLS